METFNCPYKCGDSCLEGSGKLADKTKRMIMDEYRLQAIYQYAIKWNKQFKIFSIILVLNSVSIVLLALAFILSRLL